MAVNTAGNMKVNLSIPAENGGLYGKEATKLVEVTDTTVTNNSGMTVYYNINGKNVELAAGDVYTIGQWGCNSISKIKQRPRWWGLCFALEIFSEESGLFKSSFRHELHQ